MKKFFWVNLATVFIFSCNTKQPDKEAPIRDTVSTIINKTDSTAFKTDTHYFWTSDFDRKKGMVMKRLAPISKDSLSVSNMVTRLNELYPEIILKYQKVSNDTVFLRINKSSYLTQQMGSSGAEAYLAEVTYNMTELTGINFVNLRFKQGDHAQPGIYSRTDFIQEDRNN